MVWWVVRGHQVRARVGRAGPSVRTHQSCCGVCISSGQPCPGHAHERQQVARQPQIRCSIQLHQHHRQQQQQQLQEALCGGQPSRTHARTDQAGRTPAQDAGMSRASGACSVGRGGMGCPRRPCSGVYQAHINIAGTHGVQGLLSGSGSARLCVRGVCVGDGGCASPQACVQARAAPRGAQPPPIPGGQPVVKCRFSVPNSQPLEQGHSCCTVCSKGHSVTGVPRARRRAGRAAGAVRQEPGLERPGGEMGAIPAGCRRGSGRGRALGAADHHGGARGVGAACPRGAVGAPRAAPALACLPEH